MWNHLVDPDEDYWSLSQEGEAVNTGRRLILNGIMNGVRAGETEPLQEFEAKLNIQLLLEDGGENCAAASVVLTAAFGLHCPTGHEQELKDIKEILAYVMELATPSNSIVNFFPILDMIPFEMPWLTRAKTLHRLQDVFYEKVIDEAIYGKGSGIN
ncbi:hypothetical protein H0H92_012426, partial [Tricholoma furcatifolium]